MSEDMTLSNDMTTNITLLESMTAKTADLMAGAASGSLDLRTPCEEFDVQGLLDHLATWIQVFDRAANTPSDADLPPLDIDPMNFTLERGWAELFTTHSTSLITGLRAHGVERPMVMMTDPMPGSMLMSMLLMEYVGHGWDLAVTTGQQLPFSTEEVEAADAAARSIIQPEHRGPGFFGPEVDVTDDAPAMERFVAFLGRRI